MYDFFKAGNSIADAIGKATKPLSSAQRTVLIGAVAAWVDRAAADEREACAKVSEDITFAARLERSYMSDSGAPCKIADAIRKRSDGLNNRRVTSADF